MLIEVTEALACPACLRRGEGAPLQGLVAVVDELRDRRVLRGYLGCSSCEMRYPIRDGVVIFRDEPSRRGGPSAASRADTAAGAVARAPEHSGPEPLRAEEVAAESQQLAVEVAALLGLAERPGGVLLLGEGLASVAPAVARLAAGAEVLVLAEGNPPPERGGLTVARDTPADVLPILSGRLRGVALRGGTAPRVREGARALGEGGRLVLLSPTEAGRRAAADSTLRILADEDRALVAVRR